MFLFKLRTSSAPERLAREFTPPPPTSKRSENGLKGKRPGMVGFSCRNKAALSLKRQGKPDIKSIWGMFCQGFAKETFLRIPLSIGSERQQRFGKSHVISLQPCNRSKIIRLPRKGCLRLCSLGEGTWSCLIGSLVKVFQRVGGWHICFRRELSVKLNVVPCSLLWVSQSISSSVTVCSEHRRTA
ncbi:hypothetical protein MHYP_G00256270 [Metynnis hypsauchen]